MSQRWLVALSVALVGVTFIPTGEAVCVPRHDGQDLACAWFSSTPTDMCFTQNLNPPEPGSWQSSTTCVPNGCPPEICSPKIEMRPVEAIA